MMKNKGVVGGDMTAETWQWRQSQSGATKGYNLVFFLNMRCS